MARRPGAAPGIAGFGDLRAQLVRDVLHLKCHGKQTLTGRIKEHSVPLPALSATGDQSCCFSLLGRFRRAEGFGAL